MIQAVATMSTSLPVVIRLEGNKADVGLKKLASCGLNIVAVPTFLDTAQRVVSMAKKS